jgi:multiple sugar transport system permease protein
MGKVARAQRTASAWAFLIGAVLCFSFFSWFPIVREVIMSFQKPVYGGGNTWAGLANYVRIFHDPTFWQAWRNTLEFTILALVVGYAVPFFVAILLNELRHARGYLRVLVYLPVMLPPATALVLFSYFYNPQYGLFDRLLHAVGLPVSQWVLTPGDGFFSIAMISVVIASTWMNMGSATLIYLAALQNIPGELYEAANLDGCSTWDAFRRVTLPLVRPGVAVAMVQAVIATLNVFDQPFVLNGAAETGASLTMQTYFISFQNLDFGEGYALSLLITLLTLFVSFVVVKVVYRRVEF